MITNSLTGSKYIWNLPNVEKTNLIDLAVSYNISIPIIQVLMERGISTKKDIDNYLFSSFEKDVGRPELLKDADIAVKRIIAAIKNGEKILIAGDYDVDGITSSAMMMICLLPLNAKINFFLPHRVNDGYGLSVKTVEKAAQNGYTVIVTVDNGITAFDAAAKAKELGIDLIITDHHRPRETLPVAYAIVDPHQSDCPYPFKYFAGVGVIFKLMTLLYEYMGLKLPDKVYELLLLGTVADVVPLTGENRYWVRHGLTIVNQKESLPLKILKDNVQFKKTVLSSTDIGFFITPQINALGRLENARRGVRFLIGSDQEEVHSVGAVLKDFNQARKDVEKKVYSEVINFIDPDGKGIGDQRILIAYSNSWPPGVIGLVASKIVGTYNRPTLLFHITKEGLAKGSCRSTPDLNMFNALQASKDLLISFGGHAVAAGLALDQANLPLLKERLEEYIKTAIPFVPEKPILKLDAEISLSEVNKKLTDDMQYLEPFGNENSQPIFYLRKATLIEGPTILKDAHIKCTLFSDGVLKPIIFFNRPDLYQPLLNKKEEPIDFAVCVITNEWNGKVSVELQGLDVAL